MSEELKACPDADRFWSRVDKSGHCWIWNGARQSRGYGNFVAGGKNHLAHRYAYSLVAQIPDGLVIDHKCRERRCVRPGHLRAVTQTINALENTDSPCAANANKAQCCRGHDLSGDNLRIDRRGKRVCLTCRKTERIRAKGKVS